MLNKQLNTIKKISLAVFISGVMTVNVNALADSATKITADVGYIQPSTLPQAANTINPIRLKAIRETAMQLGATGALAWRSTQIDASLEKEAAYLDHIFNFNQLLLNHDVLPPVLEQSNNSLNLSSPNALRLDSKTYKIVSPARFVTAAPTWRTYLWLDFKKPTLPDHTLLPTTQAEAAVWNIDFKKGWAQGLIQANSIFAANLNRLKRDYTGIVLYRKLLDQHMVSAPFVAKANLGVTGNANEIRINDRVLRITAPSQLQTNSNKWTPVLTHETSSSDLLSK